MESDFSVNLSHQKDSSLTSVNLCDRLRLLNALLQAQNFREIQHEG